jgi:N-acetylneuraminic acid mutarotase
MLPPPLSPRAASKVCQRTLTVAERLAYQRAVEEVYWRHRIWPKENPEPKPAFDAVISQAQLEKKVENYLLKSQVLADQRGWPLTACELQDEMERMAAHTKQPEALRELFAALGNDPFVIAECLARPTLAERLSAKPTVAAGMLSAASSSFGADAAAFTENLIRATTNVSNVQYRLPQISIATGCAEDTWTATTTVSAPDARFDHTAIWTGSEMIVWGGFNNSPPYFLNTGGKYNPATDSWVATSTAKAPAPRDFHAAVWTGAEMIVWGGYNDGNDLNTGGRYNPTTDSWAATSVVNVPQGREQFSAVWTGSEMIVWGGLGCGSNCRLNTGGRYNSITDSWTATSTINVPEARWYNSAVWTGTEMVVWGGTNQTIYLNTGGKYDPLDNSWSDTTTTNAPLGRVGHSTIWSGSEMNVWAGTDSTFSDTNTGGRYDPAADSWMAISTANAPSARDSHTAVWTGSEMIVWGGIFCCPAIDFNTGGKYSPATNSWTASSTADAPSARYFHTAVWTGSEMVVWGGYNYENQVFFNTGGRYCAPSRPTPTATPTPTVTVTPTVTPTATSTATPATTVTPTATPTSTPRATPTPRIVPTPRARPTTHPRK